MSNTGNIIKYIITIEKITTHNQAHSLTEIRKNYPNAYKPWTKEEETKLIQLKTEGVSIKEISPLLQRKVGAIKSRLEKLGFQTY